MTRELLLKVHEFVCNVDIAGDWWDKQRHALAAELDAELQAETPATSRRTEGS